MKKKFLRKDAGTVHSGMRTFQSGGLFATEGLDRAIVNLTTSNYGLATMLPAFQTNLQNPYWTAIVSKTRTGSRPSEPCDDAEVGGYKVATLTAPLGRIIQDTNTIELGQTSLTLNAGVNTALQLVGSLVDLEALGNTWPSLVSGDPLSSAYALEMINASDRIHSDLSTLLWSANPTNNVGTGHAEWKGMDMLIADNYIDALTSNAVAGLNARVIDADFDDMGGAFDIVQEFRNTADYLYDTAARTVDQASWVICMRPEYWRTLCDIWPVQYNSVFFQALYAADSASRILLSGDALNNMRNSMFQNQVLEINGQVFPVVIDNSIPYIDAVDDAVNLSGDEIASSIYFVPTSYGAGMPATYWEYVDWNAPMNMMQAASGSVGDSFVTDGGRFLWAATYNQGWCSKFKVRVEPRLILKTPTLSARIHSLKLTPAVTYRAPGTDYGGETGYNA